MGCPKALAPISSKIRLIWGKASARSGMPAKTESCARSDLCRLSESLQPVHTGLGRCFRPPAIATIRLEATAPTAMPGQAKSTRETAAAAAVACAWWSLYKLAAANIIKVRLFGNCGLRQPGTPACPHGGTVEAGSVVEQRRLYLPRCGLASQRHAVRSGLQINAETKELILSEDARLFKKARLTAVTTTRRHICVQNMFRILRRLGERAEKRIGKMLSGYAIVTLGKGESSV